MGKISLIDGHLNLRAVLGCVARKEYSVTAAAFPHFSGRASEDLGKCHQPALIATTADIFEKAAGSFVALPKAGSPEKIR